MHLPHRASLSPGLAAEGGLAAVAWPTPAVWIRLLGAGGRATVRIWTTGRHIRGS